MNSLLKQLSDWESSLTTMQKVGFAGGCVIATAFVTMELVRTMNDDEHEPSISSRAGFSFSLLQNLRLNINKYSPYTFIQRISNKFRQNSVLLTKPIPLISMAFLGTATFIYFVNNNNNNNINNNNTMISNSNHINLPLTATTATTANTVINNKIALENVGNSKYYNDIFTFISMSSLALGTLYNNTIKTVENNIPTLFGFNFETVMVYGNLLTTSFFLYNAFKMSIKKRYQRPVKSDNASVININNNNNNGNVRKPNYKSHLHRIGGVLYLLSNLFLSLSWYVNPHKPIWRYNKYTELITFGVTQISGLLLTSFSFPLFGMLPKTNNRLLRLFSFCFGTTGFAITATTGFWCQFIFNKINIARVSYGLSIIIGIYCTLLHSFDAIDMTYELLNNGKRGSSKLRMILSPRKKTQQIMNNSNNNINNNELFYTKSRFGFNNKNESNLIIKNVDELQKTGPSQINDNIIINSNSNSNTNKFNRRSSVDLYSPHYNVFVRSFYKVFYQSISFDNKHEITLLQSKFNHLIPYLSGVLGIVIAVYCSSELLISTFNDNENNNNLYVYKAIVDSKNNNNILFHLALIVFNFYSVPYTEDAFCYSLTLHNKISSKTARKMLDAVSVCCGSLFFSLIKAFLLKAYDEM